MAEITLRDAFRIVRAGALMALIPIAIWWLILGADAVTKSYICGPMPPRGAIDPAFKAWWGCVGNSMMLLTLVPVAFAAGAGLMFTNIRSDRRWAKRETSHGG